MSRMRSRMRAMLTRPSTRARGPPGQACTPRPNARWTFALGRSRRNSAGTLEEPGVAVGRSVQQHHRRPGGNVDAGDRGRSPGQPEVRLHRALDAQRLFNEVGDPVGVRPQLVLELGVLAEVLQADGEQAGGRLLAGGEQERRRPYDRSHLRRRPVGVRCRAPIASVRPRGARAGGPRCTGRTRRRASPGRSARCPRRHRARRAFPLSPKPSRKRWWSTSGTPRTSATASMAKGWRVGADELATARPDELVDLPVGQSPHERLVLLAGASA